MLSIIQDTREQSPLTFNHKYIVDVRIEKLDYGDYGAELGDGRRLPLYFERKSLNDFWGTLTQGYSRFKQEFARAQAGKARLIIIVEASLTRIRGGNVYSSRAPESILYQIFTMQARYGIETVFCNSPTEVAEYITQVFIAYAKLYAGAQK